MMKQQKNSQAINLVHASEMKSVEEKTKVSLSQLFKVAAATGLTGGVTLHFLGHVSHTSYLRMWGIDPGQFPKSVYWTSVNGYYTLFDRVANLFLVVAENWQSIGLLWLFATAFFLYLAFLNSVSKIGEPKQVKDWLLQYFPKWSFTPLVCFGLGSILTLFIPFVLLVAAMLLVIPASLGETRGQAAYESDLIKFQKGCEKAKAGNTCFELRKDGKTVAKGFLIDSSESHIALFDVNQQQARVLERSGTELNAGLPPMTQRQANARAP